MTTTNKYHYFKRETMSCSENAPVSFTRKSLTHMDGEKTPHHYHLPFCNKDSKAVSNCDFRADK